MAFGQDDPRIGFPVGLFAVLAAIVPPAVGWQLIRVLRHRLTTQQTAILGLVLFVVYVVTLFFAIGWGRATDTFVVMQPGAAWTLVAIGTAAQGLASWLKRSRSM
ncbi:MAG: hypothetical protein LC679_19825 [Intrasporangiaceae bacterium]|nr:hypothetical protein [Intrasporangiaceae bacterium]